MKHLLRRAGEEYRAHPFIFGRPRVSPLVQIGVLGDLTVQSDGNELRLPPSKKTRALLAYLAVTQRPTRRERLCEMFWEIPDDPKGALRWSLSKLRQIVDRDGRPCLEADRNTVLIRPGTVDMDYDALRGIAPGSVADLPTEQLEALAAAFRGSFLADLHLPRCPEYEAWRTSHVNETEILRLRVLRTLVDRLYEEPQRALAYAHDLQAMLPDDDLTREIEAIGERARVAAVGERTVPVPAMPEPKPIASAVAPAAAAVGAAVAVTAFPVETPAPGTPSRHQDIRFCNAPDGVRLAYALCGQGFPIVRAAHWMSHLEYDWESPVWRHWIDALSDGHTYVRYDARLNGLSQAEAEHLSLEAQVADLEAVVEAAGLERFVLLGISQGCAFSIEYAARHPERVAGLVLYGGYARGWRARGDPVEVARRDAMAVLMREGWGQDDPSFRQLFTNLFIPGAGQEQMEWFNELQRRTITPYNAWRLSLALAEIDVSHRLERIRVPTLVAHARDDRVVPFAAGVELAEKVPDARFLQLDSANHILLEEEPAFHRFLREMKGFAETVATVRPSTVVAIDERVRRQATILAADFVSPLLGLEQLDPELALEVVDPVLARAADLVRANGGIVLGFTENGLTAAFGAHEAREGHAVLACETALALSAMVGRDDNAHLRVRIALDTGVVIVGSSRTPSPGTTEVRGGPVATAQKLSQVLRRSIVAATERTWNAVGGAVAMSALAPGATAGFARDQRLFQVQEMVSGQSLRAPRSGQRPSRFVGREAALRMLEGAWQQARAGDGQTVLVVAEAGLGKSRMMREFLASLPASEMECFEGAALETSLRTGFLVVRSLLRNLFGIEESDAEMVAVRKVEHAQRERGLDERLVDPLLAVLELPVTDPGWKAVPAAEQSRRMREVVVALLAALAATRPLVVLIEDIHWIDPESEAILARAAEAIPAARIMLVMTVRPDRDRSVYAHANPLEIRLSALSAVETDALLDDLLGPDPGLASLRGMLAEACKGNPLFLEESVRALVDTGSLEGERGGYRARGPIDSIVVSPNIQSIVEARLQTLDADARLLAEVASIFARDVPAPMLQRIAGLPAARFDAAVRALKRADLLIEVQVFPEPAYGFKHALIRNAIYGRIVSASRIELHRAALAELEIAHADRFEQFAERLARHALEAQVWDKAATYLLMAAWKAIRRSALNRALEDIDLGLKLLRGPHAPDDADRRELSFQHARGIALMAARGWSAPEVLEAFERAGQLAEAVGDRSMLFTTLRGRAQYYMISGRPTAAQELACRCGQLIESSDDPGLRIETEHMFWTNTFFMGEVLKTREHTERAIALYDPERDHHLTHLYSGHDPGVCSRSFASLSSWLAGAPEDSERYSRETIELAHRHDHPLTTALAYWGESLLRMFGSEPEQVVQWAERSLDVAGRFQLGLLIPLAGFQLAWGRFMLGERDAGLRGMEEGIAGVRRIGAEMGLPHSMALHAEALSAVGRTAAATRLVKAALDLGDGNGTFFQRGEILRIRALIGRAAGADPAETEAILARASAAADSQGTAVARLRIDLDLARLRMDSGDGEGARALLQRHAELVARLGDRPDARAARELL